MVIFPLLKDLRIIRVQMGNENGDGMDGGTFGNQNWGGGRFSFKLCFQDESRCCETGKLKTEDNYVLGERTNQLFCWIPNRCL